MEHQNEQLQHYGTYYYENNGYGNAIFTNSFKTMDFFLNEPLHIYDDNNNLVSKLQWFEYDDDYYFIEYYQDAEGICDIYIQFDDSSSLGKRKQNFDFSFFKKAKYT
jgi:hypothetical protein